MSSGSGPALDSELNQRWTVADSIDCGTLLAVSARGSDVS